MHIKHIDPANMRGDSGAAIGQMFNFLKQTDGVFRSDIPDIKKTVMFSARANGTIVPKIDYLGSKSLINEYMAGAWGDDYALAIRNTDPAYAKAVAEGFAVAASGHTVTEKVEMEVYIPGSTKPVFVSYYRIVSRILLPPIWRPEPIYRLLCLTTRTEDLAQYIQRGRGYRLDG